MPWKCHSYHLSIWSHGFILHSERSIFIPKQNIVWLVFTIFSTNFSFSLIDEKKTKTKELSNDIISCNRITIRKREKRIGNLVARFSVVILGLLIYRQLEKVKYHYDNIDIKVDISDEEETEIQWWINNIDNACRHMVTPNPDIQVKVPQARDLWTLPTHGEAVS